MGIGPLRIEEDLLFLGPLHTSGELFVGQRVRIVSPPRCLGQRPETRQGDIGGAEEAAVDDKDLILKHGEEGQELEHPLQHSEKRSAVLAEAFLGKASAHLEGPNDHLLILVVPAQDVDTIREAELECDEDQPDLHSVASAINDVAVEQVYGRLRRWPLLLQDVQDIHQLAMCIANDHDLRPPGRALRQVEIQHGGLARLELLLHGQDESLGDSSRDRDLRGLPRQVPEELVRIHPYCVLDAAGARHRNPRHLELVPSLPHLLIELLHDIPVRQSQHFLALLDAVEEGHTLLAARTSRGLGSDCRHGPWPRDP
mmetsp:Transcript_68289/g.151275  ORF Transcript_68289/g.151275 Transcript_68289/m.151275 type:complete len:313 (-) Transcript_68289:104-1042(-)